MKPNPVEFNLMKERRVISRLVYFVKQCMQNVDKMYIQTFPFLRYFCSNLKGEFIIIQKLDDSEFLHVNHVTVYTTETTAGLY